MKAKLRIRDRELTSFGTQAISTGAILSQDRQQLVQLHCTFEKLLNTVTIIWNIFLYYLYSLAQHSRIFRKPPLHNTLQKWWEWRKIPPSHNVKIRNVSLKFTVKRPKDLPMTNRDNLQERYFGVCLEDWLIFYQKSVSFSQKKNFWHFFICVRNYAFLGEILLTVSS